MKTASIISIGTEIMRGMIDDTNASFLSQILRCMGIPVKLRLAVEDDQKDIVRALHLASSADLVIMTGGLGPTEDDLTKEVCAEAMGMELEEDPHTRACLEAYFKNNIYREIPENNWKMVTVPHGSIVLDNPNGMAPGLIMEKNGKTFADVDRTKYDIIVLGIQDKQISKKFIFNINLYNHKIDVGDVLVVIGNKENIERFKIECAEEGNG